MTGAPNVDELADRLTSTCTRLFAQAGAIGQKKAISAVIAIDPSWNPELWCQRNANDLRDVIRLTAAVDVGIGVIVATTAMLERDRFELARVWSRNFQWRDLVTIADAACERLPDPN